MNISQIEKNLIPDWLLEIISETYEMLSKEKVRVSKTEDIEDDSVKVEIFPLKEASVTLLILNKIATRLQNELSTQNDEHLNKIIKDVVLGYPLILSTVAIAMSNIELLEKSHEDEFKGISEEVKQVYKSEEEFFWSIILKNPQVIGLQKFSDEEIEWLKKYQDEAMQISKEIISSLSGKEDLPQDNLKHFIEKYIKDINDPTRLLLIAASIADAAYLLILLKMYPEIFLEIREKIKEIQDNQN